MTFEYNKLNTKCMWCKRINNPHPNYINETIPTKVFVSKKRRKIELCISCYEEEKEKLNISKIDFAKNLDLKFEIMKVLKF